MRRKIDEALDRVSEREKTVFLLRHYHDLSLKEIAEALGLTIGSVKSYLFRSIKKLQKELAIEAAPIEPGG
jgi:RNA polymerase sigma-70 factor (ECF subfamily)